MREQCTELSTAELTAFCTSSLCTVQALKGNPAGEFCCCLQGGILSEALQDFLARATEKLTG